jgi:hypothetical protein
VSGRRFCTRSTAESHLHTLVITTCKIGWWKGVEVLTTKQLWKLIAQTTAQQGMAVRRESCAQVQLASALLAALESNIGVPEKRKVVAVSSEKKQVVF